MARADTNPATPTLPRRCRLDFLKSHTFFVGSSETMRRHCCQNQRSFVAVPLVNLKTIRRGEVPHHRPKTDEPPRAMLRISSTEFASFILVRFVSSGFSTTRSFSFM